MRYLANVVVLSLMAALPTHALTMNAGTTAGDEQSSSKPKSAVRWETFPDAELAENYYPPQASSLLIPGSATMDCRWDDSGAISDCEVIEESPLEYGFGEATRRLLKAHGRIDMTSVQRDLPITERSAKIRYNWTMGARLVYNDVYMIPPTLADAEPYFPQALKSGESAGVVNLTCGWRRKNNKLTVAGCEVSQEFPKHKGFGDATRRLFEDKLILESIDANGKDAEDEFPVFFVWYLPETIMPKP